MNPRYPALVAMAALASVLALSGCAGEQDTVADDPPPTQASSSEPTAEPTVGSYPSFEPEDYTYHLTVTCFCVGAGVPIEVEVEDGAVVAATYLADDGGRSPVEEGDPADQTFWLTINDVVDAANDTEAARVDVDWPPGQDYPNSVYVDQEENMADEEVGYALSDVVVA